MTTTLLCRAAGWLALALLLNPALPALDHHALERDPAHGHSLALLAGAGLPHQHPFEYPHDHASATPAQAPGAGATESPGLFLVEAHEHGAPGAPGTGAGSFPPLDADPGCSGVTLCPPKPGRAPLGRALPVGAPPPEATLG